MNLLERSAGVVKMLLLGRHAGGVMVWQLKVSTTTVCSRVLAGVSEFQGSDELALMGLPR